ncbi:MAG: chorismate synthase [Oscillospiraceae bacterium]|nr:chorismate synthase [Oscillospiraceae bacterium]
MSNIYGKNIKISIFGQSHSAAIGVTVDGLPAGLTIDLDELNAFMRRRMPGGNAYSTKRKEPDEPEFLCGLVNGVTCGAPLTAIIRNTDARSSDYDNLSDVPRPSHADYTAYIKYKEARDVRGGGAFSGRLTAPLCVAGGICLQFLRREKIYISAHIAQIGKITDRDFDPVHAGEAEIRILNEAGFPVLDPEAGNQMRSAIESAHKDGDSLGGIVECAAFGVPAGIGEPMFDGMENRLAAIIFGIPAVKGVEFGNGFSAAGLRGSENNDAFIVRGDTIQTRTNNHGGILGGITSGMPLIFRAAFKPTPSISIQQDSVSLSCRKETKLTIGGRHDPCIVPRAVPCVEAAAAVAIYGALLDSQRSHLMII